ncbi:hypothetical protein [Dolichospermum sp. UHCC 0259]|uniref:hypothetical protein n=1 Tax=Dolichospermum sp. UHCC 0259 TaxID=2590010 RepID=UPI001447B22F|nr:hypothetical protein [Dolichospermum sp. UHCC 0259]
MLDILPFQKETLNLLQIPESKQININKSGSSVPNMQTLDKKISGSLLCIGNEP